MYLSQRDLTLLDGQGAPTALLQWTWGEVPTLKGIFKCTRKSGELIAAQWKKLGRDIGFDYGHAAFAKIPEQEKIAAGWGRVEVRDNGVWIVGIRWTPYAAAKIAAREFRYLSQAFNTGKDGEIISLENVALTNFPATLNAPPILLSTRPSHLLGMSTQDKKHMAMAKMLMKRCSMLAQHAQKCSESDHPGLKTMGAMLAESMAQHCSAVKAAFPDMEPDGDEGDGDGDEAQAKRKEMALSLLSFCEELTGKADAELRPALMLLSQQAKEHVEAGVINEEQQRLTLLDSMVRPVAEGGTQQIRPDQKALFASWSLDELKAWQKDAPRQGPKPTTVVQPQHVLDGRPPGEDRASTEQAQAVLDDVANLLGVSPEEAKALKLTAGGAR